MIVVIDGESQRVILAEADDLKALSVRLQDCSLMEAERILGDVGHLDAEHAWLDVKRLRALSPHVDEPRWNLGFDSAMSYARALGWTDDTGRRVRAHIASGRDSRQ